MNTFKVLIRKGERRLYVYRIDHEVERLTRAVAIALGSQPVGRKITEGDCRTPEGEYYVTHRNSASTYHLSLGLSYPNAVDAASGVSLCIIDRRQYESVLAAVERRVKPPQDTALGGDIFIHGGGIAGDWTRGCIALENNDIEELFVTLAPGTPVTIVP